jgi:hypothetical protein
MATDTDKKDKDEKEQPPKLDRENPPAGYERTEPGGDKPDKGKKDY